MDCVVKDMGDGGAKAVFTNTSIVPDDVEISIARLDKVLPARVVWRSEQAIGLTFVTPRAANIIPLDLALRLRKLEADKASLSRRVEQLTSGA